ncbi:unnamed protein product [Blumeria hordei]|uniref:Copper transport protein n=1 Tax=Blumeria hordei TaxID=2867405 RepID=A0A383UYT2_BLUHO|nr:unnamed protein product [Blumeria hordei]
MDMDMDMNMDMGHDHHGDSMPMESGSMSMQMGGMNMSFFSSTTTSLYTKMFAPNSVAAYAGMCLFLIFLAIFSRGLIAFRAWRESVWLDADRRRRYVTVPGKMTQSESMASDSDARKMVLSENGLEENVIMVEKRHMEVRPWRISVDPMRAVLDTIITAVGFLLQHVSCYVHEYWLLYLHSSGHLLGEHHFGPLRQLNALINGV